MRDLALDLATADGPGFRVGPVAELLGPVAQAALGRGELQAAERALVDRRASPLATLTRLFLLGRPVTRAELDRALPRTGTTGAEAIGLVEVAGAGRGDEVRARVDLTPYAADDDEWWLASDLTLGDGPLRPDHVLGVGGASTTLARWTPRDAVGRALDIGTGCGIQAFHLARHAPVVTATDTEPRALAMAAFNAALNSAVDGGPFAGRELDLVAGSLLEPVAGQRFDLVVSNPPYVITPRRLAESRFTYRDGGLVGDEVVRTLVTGVGAHLAPGGRAQLLGNWEHRRGESWQDRVGGWLDDSGLHGWVVQREVQDPAEYAETWARDGGHRPGSTAWAALVDAWLDDFAAREVEAIGFGVITVAAPMGTKSSAAQRIRRLEDHDGPTAAALGSAVTESLAAQLWLSSTGDRELLATRFATAPDVTEERHGRPGGADPAVIVLRQGGGLMRSARVDTALAAVVGACDGELPLGVLISAVAGLLDEPAGAVESRVVPAVRRLVADGFVVAGG